MTEYNHQLLHDIHYFWFGNMANKTDAPTEEQLKFWFGFSQDVDKEITEKYSDLLEAALRGDLDEWRDSPQGSLVLIIILDQFSRQIHRKTERAFAYDSKAFEIAHATVAAGYDRDMHFCEKIFCYLPYEHREDEQVQNKSVSLYRGLLDKSSREQYEVANLSLKMARDHLTIISRFGRFPHRNEVLGRRSTEEETKYLATENSRYGQ